MNEKREGMRAGLVEANYPRIEALAASALCGHEKFLRDDGLRNFPAAGMEIASITIEGASNFILQCLFSSALRQAQGRHGTTAAAYSIER